MGGGAANPSGCLSPVFSPGRIWALHYRPRGAVVLGESRPSSVWDPLPPDAIWFEGRAWLEEVESRRLVGLRGFQSAVGGVVDDDGHCLIVDVYSHGPRPNDYGVPVFDSTGQCLSRFEIAGNPIDVFLVEIERRSLALVVSFIHRSKTTALTLLALRDGGRLWHRERDIPYPANVSVLGDVMSLRDTGGHALFEEVIP